MPWSFGTILGAILQILLMTVLVHQLIRLFRGTRSARILIVLVSAIIAILYLAQWFHLDVLILIFKWVLIYIAFASLVVFQPELRRALADLGSRGFAQENAEKRHDRVELIATAAERLSANHHGAIIAIERKNSLEEYADPKLDAKILDAPLQIDLLESIFFPNSPLHDCGVVIRGDLIHAARCVFPLSDSNDPNLIKHGTRHRAALGLCEATDALVIVVSEETGAIRIFRQKHSGEVVTTKPLDSHNLRRVLEKALPTEVTDAWRFLLDDPTVYGGDKP